MAHFIDAVSIAFQVDERSSSSRAGVLRQFREAEERLDGTGLDLLVTCEGMSSLGQSVAEAETLEEPGEFLLLYREFAFRNRCTVAGSVKLREGEAVFNALVFFAPDGSCAGIYRKTYPTERELLSGILPGSGAETAVTPAGVLGGVICFDINFDPLRDGYAALRPDLLCFSSMCNGGHLLANWAYKCRSFLVSSVKDGLSVIVDPLGRTVNTTTYYNRITWARLNLDRFVMHCDCNIDRFPEIRRRYGKEVLIDVEQNLCTAVLYSLGERSAAEIAREFELIEIDDYLAGASAGSVREKEA